MTMIRHGEFIEKMANYAKANKGVAYRKRHANDPNVAALSEETHDAVCKLAKICDLSSMEAIRRDLCDKFKASPDNGAFKVWNKDVRKSSVIKLMNVSGLKWFELDGIPMVHWNEKP